MLQALRPSKIRGVRPAIVIDNKDGDGNPGFRVKVKFPWLNEQETSFWARIAVPMGGSGRGTYVLPEIDDQVLVVFEHGDINRPIVIGALWSKKQEPVEVNQSGKNNTKLIKSRSGQRIIFDDKEGAEKITIVDKTKKNKIILDSVNKVVKIESDGDIEVVAKTNVIMHSNALKIGTSEGVTGKGASLLCHAAKTFGLKATSGITIGGGNTTINVSNAAACSVSGSGAGELGGSGSETARQQVLARGGAGNGSTAAGNRTGAGGGGSAVPSNSAGGGRGSARGISPGGAGEAPGNAADARGPGQATGAGHSCPTGFGVAPESVSIYARDRSVLFAFDTQAAGRNAGTYTWKTTSTKLSLEDATGSPPVVHGPQLTIQAGSEPATGEIVEVTRTQTSCAPITKQVRVAIVCERFRLARPRIIAATRPLRFLEPVTTFSDPALPGGHSLSFGQDLSFTSGRRQPFGRSVGENAAELEEQMRALLTVFAAGEATGMATRLFNAFLAPQHAVSFWSDPDLTAAAARHPNAQAFMAGALLAPGTPPPDHPVGNRIHQALQAAHWDINAAVAPMDLGLPAFNEGSRIRRTEDFDNGLGVMINSLTHVIVVAKAYSYDACKQQYTIRLEFVFYDVFGLDDDDLQEFGANFWDTPAHRGITAWWQLQHQHEYAPLITRIPLEREFTVSTR